jgi:hypothetical protein
MIRQATKGIASDITEEFATILEELEPHLAFETTIDHAKILLAQRAPTTVLARSQVLLDTLLGYLMQDALGMLQHASPEVKNAFHALDLRKQIKSTYALEPGKLQLSFDIRLVSASAAAGGTLAAGGLVTAFLIGGAVPRILAGLGTLVASAFAFRLAHAASGPAARRRLKSDLVTFLSEAEAQVEAWLSDVEKAFVLAFRRFSAEHAIPQSEP